MKLIYLLLILFITSCASNSKIVEYDNISKDSLSINDEKQSLKDTLKFLIAFKETPPTKTDGSKNETSKFDTDGEGVVDRNQIKIKYKKNNNIIKKETTEISSGNIIYKTPDTMVVLVESRVIVRISKGKLNIQQVIEDLSGKVNVVPINVTSKMEVKLIDPSHESNPSFNIKSINKSEQIVEDEVYTQWDFIVTPLRSGKHELKLVVSIIRDNNTKEQTWTDMIDVKNNVPKKVLSFWEKYWQWLLTTIIIPLIIYFWKRKDEKKKNN